MGYNIGPKIGIDGEKQFKDQIKAINNEYKTLQAQTRALTAEFDKNGDQQGKLRAQAQQLEKQIDNQKYAIFKMKGALEEAKVTTGANSDAVATWERKLYDAQAAVAKMEKELADTEDALEKMENGLEDTEDALEKMENGLEDTEDALEKMENGLEDTGEAAEDAGSKAAGFADVLTGSLAADVILEALKKTAEVLKEVAVQSVEAASELRAETAQFEQTFGQMEQAATEALESIEEKTGISATRIKGNFSTVYAFAKTMGADSAEALDIASRAMTAAADSAAYYDKTVEEVTETIQAYIKGNYANDAALGIASTETTRNAAALERYGKAFKELTESQKVDTLLSMVEAGNKASGAMGQAAREAGEWTNVTGELEDAYKQLLAVVGEPVLEAAIPIVQELTQAMRELAEVTPGEQLEKDMENFVGTLETAEQTYNSTMATTLATATVASRYAEQLARLEQQGLDTAQTHAEYEAIVAQLKAIMPELNLTIDEQTGLLERNAGALLADVQAWKELAVQQALYEKMQGQLEAYGKAQLAVAEAEEKQNQITGERNANLKTLENLLGIVGAAEVKVASVSTGGFGSREVFSVYDEAGRLLTDFGNSTIFSKDQTVKLAEAVIKADRNLAELDDEIKDANGVIAEYETEMDRLTGLIEQNTDGTQENADAQQKQQQAVAETQAALLELEEAYQAAEDATRQMLDTSIGLWDEMASESDWTAGKVLENWRNQMRAFSEYAENLKKAREMGLSDGIIEALSDGSQQSMQILDAMVNQSEYSVGEINAAFTDLGVSKDEATDALMALNEELKDGYAALVEDANAAGVEIVDGMAQAIADNAYKIGEAVAENAAIPEVVPGVYALSAEMLLEALRGGTAPTASTGSSTTNQYNINITQLPGEDGEALAQRIMEQISNETQWKGAGLGG